MIDYVSVPYADRSKRVSDYPLELYTGNRPGIAIHLIDLAKSSVALTPAWTMAGWQIWFAQLSPKTKLDLPHYLGEVYIKVITGSLDYPLRNAFAAPKQIRNILTKEKYIQTTKEEAVVAVMIKTPHTPSSINIIEEAVLKGYREDLLNWHRVDKYSWGKEAFKNIPFYNLPAFQLKDSQGKEFCYVQFWAAGKGVNCGMHNHSDTPTKIAPTFAEIHFTLFNGTGKGGMVDENEVHIPLLVGEEHGPFWKIDTETGKPVLRENGAVYYDMHRWQAGGERVVNLQDEAFDIWMVFEIAPEKAVIKKGTLNSLGTSIHKLYK